MRTHLLRLTNFKGHHNFELKPGAITALKAGNGKGKTSILDAFRSLAIGGSEPDSITKGEEEATIKWVVELFEGDCDGVYGTGMFEVTRTIKHTGYSLTVKNPKNVKVPKEKAFVEACMPKLAYDPIAFDKMTDEQRAEALKGILMVPVATADIRKAAGLVNLGVIKEETFPDGVAAIEQFDAVLVEQAKGLRADVKSLTGTLETFEASIAGKSVDDVASELVKAKESHLSAVSAVNNATVRLTRERDEAISNANIAARKTANLDNEWYNEEVRKLNEALKVRQDAANETLKTAESDAHNRFATDSESELGPLRGDVATAAALLSTLEERRIEADKLAGAREQVDKWRQEKSKKAEDLERITVARNQLDSLKNKTLAKLPLEGMQIVKGRLFIDGILSSEVNTAARIMKWVEIASRYANDGQLIITDDLQSLTDENRRIFEEAMRGAGMQLIAGIVDPLDGPLRVQDTLVEK